MGRTKLLRRGIAPTDAILEIRLHHAFRLDPVVPR